MTHHLTLVGAASSAGAYGPGKEGENAREIDGLDVGTLERLLVGLCRIEKTAALTICEVNPGHAADPAAQFARLITMLTTALTPTA